MAPSFDASLSAETSDLLGQLDTLLAQEGEPDSGRLLSLAMALRQTANLAGADTVAAVAERLEDTARSVTDRNVMWSDEIRWLARQTVTDLRLVLRAMDRWGDPEEQRMRAVLARWEGVEGSDRLPERQGVPFAADPDYRQRLARAQAEAAERAAESIPAISRYFYDEGPHIVGETDDDASAGEVELPILGDPAGPGEARAGAEAAGRSDADRPPVADEAGADETVETETDEEVEAEFEAARHRFDTEFEDAPAEEEAPLISIEELLYRGDDALREARALEPRIRAALRGQTESAEELAAELFDLLELAADRSASAE